MTWGGPGFIKETHKEGNSPVERYDWDSLLEDSRQKEQTIPVNKLKLESEGEEKVQQGQMFLMYKEMRALKYFMCHVFAKKLVTQKYSKMKK